MSAACSKSKHCTVSAGLQFAFSEQCTVMRVFAYDLLCMNYDRVYYFMMLKCVEDSCTMHI